MVSYHAILYLIVPYYNTWYHIILYYILGYHIVPHGIISYIIRVWRTHSEVWAVRIIAKTNTVSRSGRQGWRTWPHPLTWSQVVHEESDQSSDQQQDHDDGGHHTSRVPFAGGCRRGAEGLRSGGTLWVPGLYLLVFSFMFSCWQKRVGVFTRHLVKA